MSTPTPEDIELADKLSDFYRSGQLARIIATYTGPLREKIAALEQDLATVKRDREYIASHWVAQLDAAHKVIADLAANPGRVPVLVGGKVVADSFGNILFREAPHPMVELAEIGRIVVAEKRLIWTAGTSLDACSAARHKVVDAVEAYLAKNPNLTTP